LGGTLEVAGSAAHENGIAPADGHRAVATWRRGSRHDAVSFGIGSVGTPQ
jgi:hypothetical protein